MEALRKIFRANIKNQLVLMLSILAIIGIFQQGVKHSLPQVLISTFAAAGLDCFLSYIKYNKRFFPTSAVISGLIISLVLSPGVNWYIPAFASVVAIGSKHIIRIKGKHIFNPANLGLLVSMFIFKAYLVWWGASIPLLVFIMGVFIVYKIKCFHLVLSFLITQYILLGAYFLLKGYPVWNAILVANFFFVFVMLVEPKTSPVKRVGRIVYGVLTGIFSSIFVLIIPTYDPSVLGLGLANLFVPIINYSISKISNRR
ncbi:MAG: RnfABCDGE type electron transport complex subunit D [Candidatus Omnitrophica bacterium]|nr:RnfABCDGE type electron transport complex subunit D [Candidatus Omnitrophota bacterium]MCM8810990.1 RnfABCDGE type electron transport complex subunit D [Candidatus Omnitrophota bacterium]